MIYKTFVIIFTVLITACGPGRQAVPPSSLQVGYSGKTELAPSMTLFVGIATEVPEVTPQVSKIVAKSETAKSKSRQEEIHTRVELYQDIYYNQVPKALGLGWEGRYAHTIVMWSEIIDQLPDYGYAYHQRAHTYLLISQNSQLVKEAHSALDMAVKDIEKAIEIGPPSGDHYKLRANIYKQYAWLEPIREDRLQWLDLALRDANLANQLGSSDPVAYIDPIHLLVKQGRCKDAMEEISELVKIRSTESNAYIWGALAEIYLCFGELEKALGFIDEAIKIHPNNMRIYTKAMILYNMGQLDKALNLLVELDPGGYSHLNEHEYFKALIYCDLGEYNLAREEIDNGLQRLGNYHGLGHYVQGLLAIVDGDGDEGIAEIEVAEKKLSFEYGPLLNRIRRELGLPELNFGKADPPESLASLFPPLSTPTPVDTFTETISLSQNISLTPGVTSTLAFTRTPSLARPLEQGEVKTPVISGTVEPTAFGNRTATEVPTDWEITKTGAQQTLTPSGQGSIIKNKDDLCIPHVHYVTRDLPVSYEGTGAFKLGTQSGGLTFYFLPKQVLEIQSIISLDFMLDSLDQIQDLRADMLLFRYATPDLIIGSPAIKLEWGANQFQNLSGFINCDAGLYVRIINRSGQPIKIKNFGVRLAARKTDGQIISAGIEMP